MYPYFKGVPEKDILALVFDMKDFKVHSEMVEKAIKTFGRVRINDISSVNMDKVFDNLTFELLIIEMLCR